MSRQQTRLEEIKAIVSRALAEAKAKDLSIVISVGARVEDGLVGTLEVFGKPSVLRFLYEEIGQDMPPEGRS